MRFGRGWSTSQPISRRIGLDLVARGCLAPPRSLTPRTCGPGSSRASAYREEREPGVSDGTIESGAAGRVDGDGEVDPRPSVRTITQLLSTVDQRLRLCAWIIGGSIINLPTEAGHAVTAALEKRTREDP